MRYFLALTAAALLCGCDAQTVSWYMAHDAERADKLTECADDPGFLGRVDPGCENAQAAAARLMMRPGGGTPSFR